MGIEALPEWHRFPDERWADCRAKADAKLQAQKRSTTTRNWDRDGNLWRVEYVGVVGEEFYGWLVGTRAQAPSLADGGHDFPGLDVKATDHWQDPWLKRIQSDPLKAPYYALVAVAERYRCCRLVGYATRDMLADAPLREYGFGPTRTLEGHELLTSDQLLARLFARAFSDRTAA